ncbi:Limulus clotting factor C [Nymphon striatum]|nr:Limulus clotting factor C [Nymphon striatum]
MNKMENAQSACQENMALGVIENVPVKMEEAVTEKENATVSTNMKGSVAKLPKVLVLQLSSAHLVLYLSISIQNKEKSQQFIANVYCPFPVPPKNGFADHSSTKEGSSIMYRCQGNYKLYGKATNKCLREGDWVNQPPICVDTCEVPKNLPVQMEVKVVNDDLPSVSSINLEATKITFSCNQGYNLDGYNTLTCVGSSWNGPTPRCSVITEQLVLCDDPGTPKGGSRKGTGPFTAGMSINFSCNENSILIGSEKIVCSSDGKWSNAIPSCLTVSEKEITCQTTGEEVMLEANEPVRMQCPAGCAEILDNIWGTVIYESKSSVCKAAIHSGKLKDKNGGAVVVINNQRYSGFVASTINGITSESKDDASKSFRFSNTRPTIFGDGAITTVCPKSWTEVDNICILAVEKDKVWEVANSICNNIDAELTTIEPEKLSKFAPFLSTEGRSYWMKPMCGLLKNEGSRGLSIVKNQDCVSLRPFICQLRLLSKGAACNDPGNVVNSKRKQKNSIEGNFYEGSEVTYTCNSLYYIEGGDTIKCQSNGNWDFPTPICHRIPACENLEPPANGFLEYTNPVIASSLAISRIGFPVPRQSKLKLRGPVPLSITSKNSETAIAKETKIEYTIPEGYHKVGARSSVTCNSKLYKRVGSRVRRCLQNGRWSGSRTSCIPVCGVSSASRSSFVANGNVSKVGEWPWQVAVSRWWVERSMFFIVCGGSLLNENWIMVAAHCVTHQKSTDVIRPTEFQIYFGKHYRNDSSDDENVQIRFVSEIHVNPNYDPITFDSDIALMKLNKPVELTSRVRPVCLPTFKSANDHLVEGKIGVVTGWGALENDLYPEELQQAKVPVVPNSQCLEDYRSEGLPLTVTDVMFCAGYKEGKADACSGDSGGPIVFQDRSTHKWIQEGIVSWGSPNGCGNKNQYGGYTRVSCDDTRFECQCGTNSKSKVRLPIKQCRPCNKIKSTDVCPKYINCLRCHENDEKNGKCTECPPGKYGAWCDGSLFNLNVLNYNVPAKMEEVVTEKENATVSTNMKGSVAKLPKVLVLQLSSVHLVLYFSISIQNKAKSQQFVANVYCPFPVPPKNGFADYSSTKEGSSIIYRCQGNYKLFGKATNKCLREGDWANQPPICVDTCQVPKNLPVQMEVKVVNDDFSKTKSYPDPPDSPDSPDYPDYPDYPDVKQSYPVAKIIKCMMDLYGIIIEQLVLCDDPGTPKGGSRKGTGPFTAGISINFSCNENSILIGSEKIVCSSDGKWSNAVPSCLTVSEKEITCQTTGEEVMMEANEPCPAGCAEIPDNIWGTVIYESKSSVCKAAIHSGKLKDKNGGAVVVINNQQYSGFVASTINGITSQSKDDASKSFRFSSTRPTIFGDGAITTVCPKSWTEVDNICILAVEKEKVWEVANSICNNIDAELTTIEPEKLSKLAPFLPTEGRSYWMKPMCGLLKNEGSRGLSIVKNQDCASLRPFICQLRLLSKGAACNDPGNVINSKRKQKNSIEGNFYEGSEVTYTCNSLYYIEGGDTIKCQSNGNWDFPTPICHRKTKIEYTIPEGYHKVGARSSVMCNSKLYTRVGSRVRRCLKNGRWSGSRTSCIPVCGVSSASRSSFVANGNVSKVGEWPWQVAVSRWWAERSIFFIVCGGSLLNENWIMVAAHCVTHPKGTDVIRPTEFQIYFGKHYRNDSSDDEYVQRRFVSEIHVNPTYDPITFDSDIALMKLNKPVELTSRVRPVCLPTFKSANDHLVEGQIGVVTGWGALENNLYPEELQQAKVPVVSNSQCVEDYRSEGLPLTVTDYMFCAGYEEGKADACSGDSGGPIVFQDRSTHKWIQEGIVSWGSPNGCGNKNQYGGYTRVERFLEWIQEFL